MYAHAMYTKMDTPLTKKVQPEPNGLAQISYEGQDCLRMLALKMEKKGIETNAPPRGGHQLVKRTRAMHTMKGQHLANSRPKAT